MAQKTRRAAGPYHHGNLRRALLDAALARIRAAGPDGFSLRELAREAGVSHAAPAHHFGDKAGLLTAIATEGYERLGAALRTHVDEGFLAVGLAYVQFAVEHPAHFEVMYRPDLLCADDPDLVAARTTTSTFLYGPAAGAVPDADALHVGIAGWAFVHGFASLWLSGNFDGRLGDDPIAAARAVGSLLFRAPNRPRAATRRK
jgi:AcrR family transcriptional regulator